MTRRVFSLFLSMLLFCFLSFNSIYAWDFYDDFYCGLGYFFDYDALQFIRDVGDNTLQWEVGNTGAGMLSLLPQFEFYTEPNFRGGGAGRIEGLPSADDNSTMFPEGGGVGRVLEYDSGEPVLTSFVTNNNTTFNIPTNIYNNTTNNYYNQYDITNITYNETYNIYNVTTNEYNYYINYSPTYITVINYVPDLDVYDISIFYYRLPDGRASWDLTADEIWGTVFSYNAVNYDSVPEDDGVTLALYHMDGDLKDSSSNNAQATATFYNFADDGWGGSLYNNGSQLYFYPNAFTNYVNTSPYTLEFRIKSSVAISYPSSLGANIWHSIAVCYNGSSYSVYFNGTLSTSTYSTSLSLGTTNLFSYYFSGRHFLLTSNSSFQIDEVRFSKGVLYTSNYIPRNQPFDTNNVFVLPESGNENDIAIKSLVSVTNYRIGGVRPTYPTNGYVYVYLENNKITSIQQFQTDGWYEVDGAVYIDGDWVNAKNYDMSHAILDNTGSGDGDGSGGGSGDGNGDGTGDGSGNGDGTGDGSGDSSDDSICGKLLESIAGFFGSIFDFLISIAATLIDGFTKLFDNILSLFNSLIDFVNPFASFLTVIFPFIPSELLMLVELALTLAIILTIIKFVRK